MECERLDRLVRAWYVQVQEESLAPARMVEFMEKHMVDCPVCQADPDVRYEVRKITEIVLPPSKMTKVVKKAVSVPDGPPPTINGSVNGSAAENGGDQPVAAIQG